MQGRDKCASPDYTQYQDLELHEAPKWWQILTRFRGVDLSKVTITLLALVAKDWNLSLIAIICICLLELIELLRHARKPCRVQHEN